MTSLAELTDRLGAAVAEAVGPDDAVLTLTAEEARALLPDLETALTQSLLYEDPEGMSSVPFREIEGRLGRALRPDERGWLLMIRERV